MSGAGDAVSALAGGLQTTLALLALSVAFGLPLALATALARLSGVAALRWPAAAYVSAFRGTPLLVQLFLIYYGLPQFGAVRHSVLWPMLRHAWPCAVLAFSLNMGAYASEVVRAAIGAVPSGEREAALVLGLTRGQVFRAVTLPRAFRLGLPALGNEVVVQLKGTALASTITVVDLTGSARRLSSASFGALPLLEAGLLYVAVAAVLSLGLALIERAVRA